MNGYIKVKEPKAIATVLMLGSFIGLFSETALNMALTNVMDEFSIPTSTAQWLTTGYLLTLAILVPISALLMKWFTTRQLVIGGLLISLIGTVLSATSGNFTVLITGRIVQAIGTGIIMPVMTSVLLVIFPIKKRGVVFGIMGLVITLGPALGPTLSGIVIGTLGWNYIFWFSAAFYSILTFVALTKIVNVSVITQPKVDLLSIVLSSFGFGGIIYALASLAKAAFSSPIIWVPLLTGILCLIFFGIRQNNMEKPMIDLHVFSYAMFSLGSLIMFFSLLIVLSASILLPLYLKGALFFSPVLAGLLLLPGNTVNVIMSPIVGSLFDKFGAKKLTILGAVIVFIGNILFVTTISTTTSPWQIILAFMLFCLGMTMVTIPAQTNALNALPPHLYGDGSAAINTLIQLAGAAGTAISISLLTAGQALYAETVVTAADYEMLAHGVKYVFYFITGVSVVTILSSLFMKGANTIK